MEEDVAVDFAVTVKRGLWFNGDFVSGHELEAAKCNPYEHTVKVLTNVKSGFFLEKENADDFRSEVIPKAHETLKIFLLARDRETAEKYAHAYSK